MPVNIPKTPILALLSVVPVLFAQTRPENIASACAGCHASQARPQPDSPMGRGMQWPEANPLFRAHPDLTFHKGAYTYTVETKGEKTIYSVTDGTRTVS